MRRTTFEWALPPEQYIISKPADLERFFAKVEMDPNSGCWLWSAYIDIGGYGRFGVKGEPRQAHRVAYCSLVAPVPTHLVLDHRCRTRSCVNPAHLRVVTFRQNTLENSVSPIALNVAKTHCPKGHEYTEDNTYRRPGNERHRICRACHQARNEASAAALRAERRAAGSRGAMAERTHCPRGHPLSGENLYLRPGPKFQRGCKECRRQVTRDRYREAHGLLVCEAVA